MKISVALAAYKGEKFIGEQIASLLEQTLLPDEIVITDDSPDDLTEKAVKKFSDPRIRYFRNGEQLGVNGNFARAISMTGGEIIFLCDQDDVWKKDKIGKMVDALEKDPDADGVFCNSTVVDEKLIPQGFSLWQMREFSQKMQKQFVSGKQLEVFLKRVTCSTHNIAIRRKVLDLALPFPYLDPFYADTFLGLLIAASGKWAVVPEELTAYRVHGSNLSAPKLANLADQFQLSRRARKKNFLLRTAELTEELLKRLPENTPENIRGKLTGFARHYTIRNGYSRHFFIRIFQVAAEIFSCRYSCYSNGWKSIAADLFLFQ